MVLKSLKPKRFGPKSEKKTGRARPGPRFCILLQVRAEIVTSLSDPAKIFIFSSGLKSPARADLYWKVTMLKKKNVITHACRNSLEVQIAWFILLLLNLYINKKIVIHVIHVYHYKKKKVSCLTCFNMHWFGPRHHPFSSFWSLIWKGCASLP